MMQGIASLVAESMSLSFQLKSRGHPPKRTRDRFGNFATDERFAEHVADPCGLRSLAELRTAVTAHEHDRNVGVQLPDLARELGPCQVRHRLVGQYEIGALWLRAKRLQGRGTRVKPYGLIIEFRKNLFRERGHFPGERPALRRAALGKRRAPAAACSMALHVPRRVAGLSPLKPELAAIAAARMVLREIDRLVAARLDFAFETTLSGLTYVRRLQSWKQAGYRIEMVYLRLRTAQLALRRISGRVKQGGHDVPRLDVVRRFSRGWDNFQGIYRPLADSWAVYDNSDREPRLMEKSP
jgi:predicted ABC-type ATPase